ncbi:GNAT acetyltransferase [Aureococcus anophagefferens]|uniref:GNAT acetyltransferase n=1 Tax=Aureococcus anophagefferens TaxID=44056 RepID=A0ABR1FH91_AURAN
MGAAITTATLVIGLSASCGAFSSTAQPRPPTALRAKKADPSRVADGLVLAYRGALLASATALAAGTVRAGLEGSGLAVDGPFDGRGEARPSGEIAAERTVDVREAVLWPGRRDMCVLASDGDGTHFGAFFPAADNERPVGVISLFLEGDEATFRKFAVLEDFRRRGVGGTLLAACEAAAADRGAAAIACDARAEQAIAFYFYGALLRADARPSKRPGSDEVYVRMRKPLGSVVD